MASVLSYIPLVNRLVSSAKQPATVDLPPVEVHREVETAADKRPRTLKHLLRANHVNHAIVYHDLRFANHLPHALCSAYLLGADAPGLHAVYDAGQAELEPWRPSPAEVVQADWRDFLGDARYQRAYVDFYEDALAYQGAYDWRKVVDQYMFAGEEPLVNGLIGGLGHPLIHLGYAYEMDNKELAIEALGLASVQYDFLHKYIDDPSYRQRSSSTTIEAAGSAATTNPHTSATPLELLGKMARDKRLKSLFKEPGGIDNLEALFEQHEDLVLEYWNAWAPEQAQGESEANANTSTNMAAQFRASQEAATALLVATVAPGTHAYDFFLAHVLTTSHAVRILLPVVPARHHLALLRQWWLLAVAVYILRGCPAVDPDYVAPDAGGKFWDHVEDRARNGPYATDAHFLKAVRAMREAARTWGDLHERYLAAAVRFVDDFNGWTF
ncbi:hypothetical protein SLS62_004318 [Diatrype stigma]|uniref:MGS207 protein n=1 Tax=Diatrype stigma TaxID=117547 RepID=A0AAN9YQM1_9PEZI